MERAAGPIIGVCAMLVIGLGLYSWSLHSSLASSEARLALVTKNADTSKTNADTFKTQVTSQTVPISIHAGVSSTSAELVAQLEDTEAPEANITFGSEKTSTPPSIMQRIASEMQQRACVDDNRLATHPCGHRARQGKDHAGHVLA